MGAKSPLRFIESCGASDGELIDAGGPRNQCGLYAQQAVRAAIPMVAACRCLRFKVFAGRCTSIEIERKLMQLRFKVFA